MIRTVCFTVTGLPPKKDCAKSLWSEDQEKVAKLRQAAYIGIGKNFFKKWVRLVVIMYAKPEDGDLDNFIGGICDALKPVPQNTNFNRNYWLTLPADIAPYQSIAFQDDKIVNEIIAKREIVESEEYNCYRVVLMGE
ncbi:MAG: hypothetical protein K6357_06850 [Elusimicrobiota bacterium]